jgi:hypothetical protein
MEKLELENTWFERCFNQGETLAVGKPISGIGELLVNQRPRPQISSAHPGWKSQGCETNIAFKLVKVIHLL